MSDVFIVRSRRIVETIDKAFAKVLLLAIASYRVGLSWFFRGSCRFVPSCSAYASEAIEKYGGGRGMIMAILRITRCHPFHPGGFDPVP